MYTFITFYLGLTFLYTRINFWSLGYLGIFYLILISIFYSVLIAVSELYNIWLYSITIEYSAFIWSEIGNNIITYWNYRLDFFGEILSLVMLSGAFFVILFVFVDMWDDKEGHLFVINLGFFMTFMLVVANAGNLILFYLGWEGIGLTSLFLVNFWSERARGIKASFKIFFINKIGDYFVLILICLLGAIFGDLDFDTINALAPLLLNYNYNVGSLSLNITELLGIILLFGGCVKSAQYGFHIWLLEAMEAPLGASALMHSSTLVVAGLVLIYKLSVLIELSGYSQILMFVMGAFSATCGALIACFQFELKVIMAYSTISNMGYMFLLFAIGAYYETVIVMVLHAYIKIFMFLIVGGIILHCNGSQDIRWMGGLLPYIPTLWVAYVIGGSCLVGLPYWSGYYCKHYILLALSTSYNLFLGIEFILLISYFLTIFYVSRTGYLVFLGSKNGHRRVYRNKPTSLLYVTDLLLLGIIILFSGYFWINLLYINKELLYNNIFIKGSLLTGNIFNEIPYDSLYLWVFIYFLNLFTFVYFFLITANVENNLFKHWFILISTILFLYLLYTHNLFWVVNNLLIQIK